MGLRPGRTVRKPERAWTRTAKRKVKKAFVRGVPDSRVRSFDMGDAKPKDCEIELGLLSGGHFQIRDNALESARVMANKVFENKIGIENYFFKIKVFPHQCLRERSILTGAGADRLSSHHLWFGRPVGRAAVVKRGQEIMTVYTMKKFEEIAREGLYRASQKVPGKCKTKKTDLTKKKKKKLPPGRKRKKGPK